MSERDLQTAALEYLNSKDHTVARCNSAGPGHVNGDPDIYGCVGGVMFHLEAKQEGGRLSRAQEYRLEEWRKAGALAFVVRNMDDVREAYYDTHEVASRHAMIP